MEVYGINHQLTEVTEPNEKVPSHSERAEIRMSEDFYEFNSALSANDVILLQKIPANAKIVDVEVIAPADNGSTVGGTFDIGWTAGKEGLEALSADGFFAAEAGAAAGTSVKLSEGINEAYGKVFAEQVYLAMTVVTANTATDGSKMGVRVYFVED